MSGPKATRLILENGTSTLGAGSEPAQSYAVMGRSTKDSLTNKVITDPSNRVAASQLTVAGTPVPLEADGAAGTVLTRTATGAAFLPGGGGGGGSYDVVVVPFTGLVSNTFVTLGAPIDIVGSSAADITVQASATPGTGDEFLSSKDILGVEMQMGLQYITQGSARRTFANVLVGGVTQPSPGAQTVVNGINNFRQTFDYFVWGIGATDPVKATVNSNATPTITLNGGRFYILLSP